MSQINRPFRGFSGTFPQPDLPLTHPEIPLEQPVTHSNDSAPGHARNTSGGSPTRPPLSMHRSRKSRQPSNTPPSDADARPSQARKPSHRLLRSISGIFSKHHADGSSRRKSKSCEATTCKNSSNVIIYHGDGNFTEKQKAEYDEETQKLYMACYTKAERRQMYREAKKRETEEMERRGSYSATCAVYDDDEDDLANPAADEECTCAPRPADVLPAPSLLSSSPEAAAADGELCAAQLSPSDAFEPAGIVKAATWASNSTGGNASAVFTMKSGYASSMSSFDAQEGERKSGESRRESGEGERERKGEKSGAVGSLH